jgi:DNA-binding transcriptional MerR regulator
MTKEERIEIVKKLLAEGRSLSQIQDFLRKEKADSITYMELRLLLSEIPDLKLPEKEQPKAPAVAAPTAGVKPAATESTMSPVGGKLSVSVDQMPAPGAMISGYARFSSGARAHWFIDEMGRLGLDPELGTGKPTQDDMKEFSTELRRMLQQG